MKADYIKHKNIPSNINSNRVILKNIQMKKTEYKIIPTEPILTFSEKKAQ